MGCFFFGRRKRLSGYEKIIEVSSKKDCVDVICFWRRAEVGCKESGLELLGGEGSPESSSSSDSNEGEEVSEGLEFEGYNNNNEEESDSDESLPLVGGVLRLDGVSRFSQRHGGL